MVIDGKWVMTEDEIKRHEADALHSFAMARRDYQLVKADLESIERRLIIVADLLREARASEDFLHGPIAKVLSLPADKFGEAQSLTSIKAVAEALVVAHRQMVDARQRAHDLGVTI